MDPERLQVIDTANKLFGESGWSFSISNVVLDYIEDSHPMQYNAGTSAVVRVHRSNGIFREDVGYGWSSGPNKAEVISKAKKEAVTDGLKGAIFNFGGDVARKVNAITPRKLVNENRDTSTSYQTSNQAQSNKNHGTSTSYQTANQAQSTPISPQQTPLIVGGKTTIPPTISVQVLPSIPSTSPVTVPKTDPIRVTPVRSSSPPLALPLPTSVTHQSEGELAKIERKRRQRQLQEEFRKKHLLEQAHAQSKAPEKGMAKNPVQPPRAPLKEQQVPKCQTSKSNGNGTNSLDGEDEVFLSTQDIEAISAIAANNSVSRHMPMISSPSIARVSGPEVNEQSSRPSGHKRPDLSSYAFNAEKRAKGM